MSKFQACVKLRLLTARGNKGEGIRDGDATFFTNKLLNLAHVPFSPAVGMILSDGNRKLFPTAIIIIILRSDISHSMSSTLADTFLVPIVFLIFVIISLFSIITFISVAMISTFGPSKSETNLRIATQGYSHGRS